MSYLTKMQLRMLLPCILPLLIGTFVSWAISAVIRLSNGSGSQSAFPDLGDCIFFAGVAVAMGMAVLQCIRLWRWEKGEGDTCYVCGCLLGIEKDGPFGPYRPCLGCPKNHALH